LIIPKNNAIVSIHLNLLRLEIPVYYFISNLLFIIVYLHKKLKHFLLKINRGKNFIKNWIANIKIDKYSLFDDDIYKWLLL
jgi:hypothetical protein